MQIVWARLISARGHIINASSDCVHCPTPNERVARGTNDHSAFFRIWVIFCSWLLPAFGSTYPAHHPNRLHRKIESASSKNAPDMRFTISQSSKPTSRVATSSINVVPDASAISTTDLQRIGPVSFGFQKSTANRKEEMRRPIRISYTFYVIRLPNLNNIRYMTPDASSFHS